MTVGSCVLTPLLDSFEAKHPQVQVQAVVDNTHAIEEMLLDSRLDLALVEGEIHSPDLLVRPVIRDELVSSVRRITPLPGGRGFWPRSWRDSPLSFGKRAAAPAPGWRNS